MGNRRPLTAFGCIFMLASIGISIAFFGFELPKMNALKGREGRDAVGIVSTLDQERSGKSTGYYADISFTDENSVPHTMRAFYPMPEWMSMQVGQRVPLRYLAKEPTYAIDPNSYKGKRNPWVLFSICAGLFVVGFALFVVSRVLIR